MNIFALDLDPKKCAQYHNNKHVCKMLLEGAQLLSNVHHLKTGTGPFNLGWQHHKCTYWTGETKENYRWLSKLVVELCKEYTFRYGRIHARYDTALYLKDNIPTLPKGSLTKFALAMPDDCKLDCPIESYRLYYHRYKQHLKQYKRRTTPIWY